MDTWDRSSDSIHLLPAAVSVDVSAYAALGRPPPSTSSIQHPASFPFFKEQVYICCLRDKTSAVSTSLKIDFYGFFCIYTQSRDPCQQVNLQLQGRDGEGGSGGMHKGWICFGDVSTANVLHCSHIGSG